MLTPRDIESKEFARTKFSGYKVEEVEAFLDEILADYITLTEERENLSKRVLVLSEKLETIRDEQDEWKQTLLSTQKSYETVIAEANAKSSEIIAEAEKRAAELDDATKKKLSSVVESEKNTVDTYKAQAESAKAEQAEVITKTEAFKNSLIAIYERQIEELKNVVIPEAPTVAAVVTKTAETIAPATETETAAKPDIDISGDEFKAALSLDFIEDNADSDISKTIIAPAVKATLSVGEPVPAKPLIIDDDDDDEFIFSKKKSASDGGKKLSTETKESKLKDLFDDKFSKDDKKSEKPAKKRSKFFKFDDDDDDDFYDDDN